MSRFFGTIRNNSERKRSTFQQDIVKPYATLRCCYEMIKSITKLKIHDDFIPEGKRLEYHYHSEITKLRSSYAN